MIRINYYKKNDKLVIETKINKGGEVVKSIPYRYLWDRIDIPQAVSQGSPESEGFN